MQLELPLVLLIEVLQRQLLHNDSARLKVNLLMLDTHKNDPVNAVLRDWLTLLYRVLVDEIADELAYFFAVIFDTIEILEPFLIGLRARPVIVVLEDVVPAHLVDAHRVDALKVRVEALALIHEFPGH